MAGTGNPGAGAAATLPPGLQSPPATPCWGSTSRVLGLLAHALGRCDEAARHFEDAIEHNSALGARTWHARGLLEYAGLLRERGDAARAQTLLREVAATARELEVVDIGVRAEAALDAS